jgi:hypothetical protein
VTIFPPFLIQLLQFGGYFQAPPAGFVPIADDPGGNLYLLDCDRNSDRNGKVYFWNHEGAEPTEDPALSNFKNITLLFDSFSQFLDALKGKDLA